MAAYPLSNPPVTDPMVTQSGHATRVGAAWQRDVTERLKQQETGTTIADADGTLADATRAINELLAVFRDLGIIE